MKQSGIAEQMNPERRRFLEICGRYGFTTAVLASIGGYLWSDDAIAQTAADEEAKQKAAKFTMLFATEYKNEDWSHLPIPQSQFKTNLEASSKNAIYVKLHPAGQLGIGAALAQKIQGGTVQGGAVSLSNFSPYAPAVDLINIPFWCGENQKFANLVTSRAWNDEITPKVTTRGYQPIFYFTMDSRTISSRKGFRPVKVPGDMQGMKMRVPPSQLLQTFYRLAGANPTVVPWGETATAIKQGVADGLDPAIVTAVHVRIRRHPRPSDRRALCFRRADVRRERRLVSGAAERPSDRVRCGGRAHTAGVVRADREGACGVDRRIQEGGRAVLRDQRLGVQAMGGCVRRASQGVGGVQGEIRGLGRQLRETQGGGEHQGPHYGRRIHRLNLRARSGAPATKHHLPRRGGALVRSAAATPAR